MIVVRSCHGHEELEACVQLQVATWGYDPTDVIPRKAFLVWQKVGGQILGAFDTDVSDSSPEGDSSSLVAFLAALPGIKGNDGPPRPYLHSHMLAVKEAYRNRGLGARLKLAQRDEALSRGIRLIEWTFDPLEIKNAFLNIAKLGAIARTYLIDFYGVSSSRLQGGLPTDRLVAEWHIDSPLVPAILDGKTAQQLEIQEQITVPAKIYEWKATETGREKALEVQHENRRKFQQAFSQGLAVSGFIRDAEGNGIYQLSASSQLELSQHKDSTR